MALATAYSRALIGVEAPLVTVETHLSNGLPSLSIVGMPETAVRESRERVRSAIINSGLEFPARRITINLAPADLPKSGGRYDLAIALSILAASEQIPADRLGQFEFLGELALGGEIRGVHGVLPAVVQIQKTGRCLILPSTNSHEAALVRNALTAHGNNLLQVCTSLVNGVPLESCSLSSDQDTPAISRPGVGQLIRGQLHAKRALQIAAAGQHNLLMVGPPGTGKTLLANSLPPLLPRLSEQQALELAAVRSVAGHNIDPQAWDLPPFRAPHHSASSVSLVGGGGRVKPGEISLAHHGVLFLDELPEFNRQVLEVLREPLESGSITLSRAGYRLQFPARFQLVAAMNPCPCGYAGDISGTCRCSPERVYAYRQKISGPLLDRIDMVVTVPRLSPAELSTRTQYETDFSAMREHIALCRELQMARNGKPNSALIGKELETVCVLDDQARKWLIDATTRLRLSARAYHRVIKLARTICDFENRQMISVDELSEAIAYRAALTG